MVYWEVWDKTIINSIIPKVGKNTILNAYKEDWFNMLDSIFWFIKDKLFWFLMILSIWAFLYVWARLIIARWNPEEFKKAMLHFVYIVIWLFVITAAWALVKLVSWLNF